MGLSPKFKRLLIDRYIGKENYDQLHAETKRVLIISFIKDFELDMIHEFGSLYNYTKWWVKNLGFKSINEYRNHLAREKGFKNCTEYMNHLARQKGYRNQYQIQRESWRKKGFKSCIDYYNHLARKRGFKNRTKYANQHPLSWHQGLRFGSQTTWTWASARRQRHSQYTSHAVSTVPG